MRVARNYKTCPQPQKKGILEQGIQTITDGGIQSKEIYEKIQPH